MNHRQRAQTRIARHVPQLRGGDSGALHERLSIRQEEGERPERAVLGDTLVVRDGNEGTTKYLRPADVSENAPLLMRLVRHPYGMEPVVHERVEGRPAVGAHQRPEPLEPALAYRRELRDAYRLQHPTVACAHRPEARRAPFATVRADREAPSPAVVEGLPVPDDAIRLHGAWTGAPRSERGGAS